MKSLSIDTLRTEIDREHELIFSSLLRRFSLAEKIWEIKKQNSDNFIDLSREKNLICQFDQKTEVLQNPELKNALHTIFQSIIDENKKYLKSKIQTEKGTCD